MHLLAVNSQHNDLLDSHMGSVEHYADFVRMVANKLSSESVELIHDLSCSVLTGHDGRPLRRDSVFHGGVG